MKKRLLLLGVVFVCSSARVGFTHALFTDSGRTTGTFAAATDWHAPVSNASVSTVYQTGATFSIDYTASDNETGLAHVLLYYRKGNTGAYTLYGTNDYSGNASAVGSFLFTASQDDGIYEFYTVATDVYGNVEAVPISPDATTTLDTIKPVATLSTSGGVVIGEKITNGNFDSPLGSGWNAAGSVSRLTSESLDTNGDSIPDVMFMPPSGSGYMARVGTSENQAGTVSGNSIWDNKLSQTFDHTNSYLSFYWRAVSFDTGENPAVVVMANDKEILRVTGLDINTGGYPNDSGWQHAFLDLSTLTDDKVELRFYAGNSDSSHTNQSWVYIANVTTGRPAINSSSNVIISATDATSGIASIAYSLDSGANWTTAAGNSVSIPGSASVAGINEFKYYATDNAGNIEDIPSSPTEVILTDSAPGSPTSFSASGISEHEIQTSWIAPSGTGYFTRAASYQLRVNTSALDTSNFSSGSLVPNTIAPASNGESQSFMISGLSANTNYWVGVVACDPVGNCSDPVIATASTILEHTVDPGDVVINELHWMGTDVSPSDEWIELRNMTDLAIDLSGWQLTKKSGGSEMWMYAVPPATSIPANGYLLISEFDKDHSALNVTPDLLVGTGTDDDPNFELSNINLQIKLYKGDWSDPANVIDSADDGTDNPAAGLSSLNGNPVYYSMERNATPGNGEDASNWHTTFADTRAFFDEGLTMVKGTPGAINQSESFVLVTTTPTPTLEPIQESTPSATPTLVVLTPTPEVTVEPTVMPMMTPTPEPTVEPTRAPAIETTVEIAPLDLSTSLR